MADAAVSCYRIAQLFTCVLATVLVGFAAAAQDIPVDSEADLVFQQAVEAYEAGDFGMAARRFQLVVSSYPLNTRTTAAWLMAGKSLYQAGQHERSASLLNDFTRSYPSSRYAPEARSIITFANEYQEVFNDTDVIEIGVLLPLEGDSRSLTQSMFDGIRLAVDEFNNVPGENNKRARLVFRESSSDAIETTRAVRELAEEEVSLFVGPLYSSEAITAAIVAEEEELVMVAPLATDEEVSAGKDYVFQANPTIDMRGRLMARFAMTGLRHKKFGVIAEFDNAVSERMAEGFQDEVSLQGGQIDFVDLLPGSNSWFRLKDRLIPDSLLNIDAIYVPVAGGSAQTLVKGALDSFDRIGVPVRLLGNKEFHDLPSKSQASTYHTVYTTDFRLNEENPAVELFEQRYAAFSDRQPAELTFVGYDVTRFLLQQLLGEDDARRALDRSGYYQGLGIRIDFQGENVNHALYYLRYRNGELELIQ